MTWTSDTAYLEGLDVMSDVVARLGPDDWDHPSPCAGWTARDVLGHVGVAAMFGTALLRGETPKWDPVDPPGAAVEGDPAAWWAGLVGDARAAVVGADLDLVVDSPMGRRSVAEGLSFPAMDLFLHAWDLARTVSGEVEIPDEAIAFAHAALEPVPEETVRSPGVFGPEVPAPEGAAPTEAFVAWTGRDPGWKPSS